MNELIISGKSVSIISSFLQSLVSECISTSVLAGKVVPAKAAAAAAESSSSSDDSSDSEEEKKTTKAPAKAAAKAPAKV